MTKASASRLTTAKPAVLLETERAQLAASDPGVSAWVSANAGAGKTHVLKTRVQRLLLSGATPDRILCLTYTKAAAAEMASRVFADLARFATAGEEELTNALKRLLDREPSSDERRLARELFARAIETPGGLKVQTIHAFAERLLQRFPLEAGVPPGFTILDEETGGELVREAIDAMLVAATRAPGSSLARAVEAVVAYAEGDRFDRLLKSALAKRGWLDAMSRLSLMAPDPQTAVLDLYRRLLGVGPGRGEASIVADLAGVLTEAELRRAYDLLSTGSQTDRSNAATLSAALAAADHARRVDALARYFLTKEGEPRSRLATTAIAKAAPDLVDRLTRAQARFVRLGEERRASRLAEATAALVEVAEAVMQRYREAKARRAALDFEDLIVETARLLGAENATEWVRYKLDGGLDHILVDEAQDTSADQWRIVEALAREFFAGASAREVPRTVFAVGDLKQSIYSFQGAVPRQFAEMGARFAELARNTAQPWRVVPLTLSFRSVAPVLAAVDRVFADPGATPGLSAAEAAIRHLALRNEDAGLVELWPTETAEDSELTDAFAPLSETVAQSPAVRLAEKIADTIARWLAGGERLLSEDRPITAGDIIILVRKRRPFAGPMVSALKRRAIPVAGADRLRLLDEIAVQDLLALADFLLLPEDDLSLAAVLKSPIFDLNDDDLLAIAPGRRGSLWKALLAEARTNSRFAPAADALKRWRSAADFLPPYEFLARLLDEEGLRAKLLARLGPDAADPIDELVNLALKFDKSEPPSLQGFLQWLRASERQIKRDMEHGRDAVRVMTVHGAKGLEAPIVFLPDTCSAPSRSRPGELTPLGDVKLPAGLDAAFAWQVRGTKDVAALQAGSRQRQQEEQEEHNRLLYVAMTRARDRLYIAGFEGKKGRPRGCWYDLVATALTDLTTEEIGSDGSIVRRLASRQSGAARRAGSGRVQTIAPQALPSWATQRARAEPMLAVPLAPSRLAPYDTDEEGEPVERARKEPVHDEPPHPSPRVLAGDGRFLRGTLTHALLQHLPTIDPPRREQAAKTFVALRGAALPARVQASIVSEVLAVLAEPAFAPVFGPASRAEVPIVAEIDPPAGHGPKLKLAGQIDRLAVLDDGVLVIDYKTNRPPPKEAEAIAPAYLYQLAAYRLALRAIYPGKPVRAAILWTDGTRLMPVPDALLDAHERGLWSLAR